MVLGASLTQWGACGDVDDVSGVEDDFFSAVDSRAEGFAGTACGVVRMLVLHGALGDESYCAFRDDNLIGEELMALGVAGVEADDQQGVVVAVVFKPTDGEAGGTCLGGFDQLGFALLEVSGGVDDGVGLGEEWRCCECEGEEDGTGHAGSLGWPIVMVFRWTAAPTAIGVGLRLIRRRVLCYREVAMEKRLYELIRSELRRRKMRRGALAVGSVAVGSLALGAMAMGALAIGALAIGRLALGSGHVKKLRIEELTVDRLVVKESIRQG